MLSNINLFGLVGSVVNSHAVGKIAKISQPTIRTSSLGCNSSNSSPDTARFSREIHRNKNSMQYC